MTRTRLLLALLSSALGCLLAVPLADDGGEGGGAMAGVAARDRTRPLTILRDWDRARAAAWRAGDPAALGALYTRGSATGRADRALMAAYAGRGLRVAGMRMQVADVEVASVSADRLELLVTDRLVGARAVGHGVRVGLPRDSWSRRRLVLVRVAGEWRVSEVRGQVSIVASTDSTSGSRNS